MLDGSYKLIFIMVVALLLGAFVYNVSSELFSSPRQGETWNVKYVDPNTMDSSQFAGSGPTCAKINDTQCAMNPLYPFN